MKTNGDVAKGWLQKVNSDLSAAQILLKAGETFDVICFHAEQAAEKALKAFLIYHDTPFPFTHNLEKLLVLCGQSDEAFKSLKLQGDLLTPYATDPRYDEEFWPDESQAYEALEAAKTIIDFVLSKLPPEFRTV